jgi:replicative DNA helicase
MNEIQKPKALEAEKYVLSVVMQKLPGWDDKPIAPEWFYSQHYRRLYEFATSNKLPADVQGDLSLTVEALKQRGMINGTDGVADIAQILVNAPTISHFGQSVDAMRDCHSRRLAIDAAENLAERAADMNDKTGFVEATGQPMTEVAESATDTETTRDRAALLKAVLDEFNDLADGKSHPNGFEVSLSTLSAALRGFKTPRYCVIAGFPGSGKTLLAGQFLTDIASTGTPCLMISCEMTAQQIMQRFIGTYGRLPSELLSDPLSHAKRQKMTEVSEKERNAFKEAYRAIEGMPLYFEEPVSPKLSQIITMIRRAHKRHGVKVIGIDYLQLIQVTNASSKEQELTQISHALQGIAKELDLLIFVLSQQNKEGHLKYATSINEDADYVLSLVQDMREDSKNYLCVTDITVKKDRHTGRSGMNFPIKRDADKIYFEEA